MRNYTIQPGVCQIIGGAHFDLTAPTPPEGIVHDLKHSAHRYPCSRARREHHETPRRAIATSHSKTGADRRHNDLVIHDFKYPLFPRGGWDLERRIGDMDRTGVHRQVLSVPPFTFFYDQDPHLAVETCQVQNNRIAEILAQHSERFFGFAAVPLQDPELAATELERAIGLGLHGAEICTNVAGRNLDEPELDEFWAKATLLDVPILLHPHNVAAMDRLGKYYLNNLIGNPLDTTIAIGSLIFGGVLDRFPTLKLCFVHGGGYFPYQWGRLEHGYHVRTEPHIHAAKAPREYLDRFSFDTITHSMGALEYLI